MCPLAGKPRLSLGLTDELAEVVGWTEVLDQCMVGLTVLQPEFCRANVEGGSVLLGNDW